jgi:hypothetical protein
VEIELTGGDQMIELELPPLGDLEECLWGLDRASAGDTVVLDSVSFTATTSITDAATAAFVQPSAASTFTAKDSVCICAPRGEYHVGAG